MNSFERLPDWYRARILYIVVSLGLAAGFLGIRFQNPFLIVPAVLLLLLTVLAGSRAGLLSLGAVFSFMFVGPSIGWLYGRDANGTALAASVIRDSGWPLEQTLNSFTGTPLIHFHAILVSEISNLPLLPSSVWRLSAPSVLPIIYMIVLLSIVYLTARRLSNQSRLTPLMALPVFLWIPMYSFRTRFHRNSLGLLLFGTIVFTLYLRDDLDALQSRVLLGLSVIAIVATHHVAAVMAVTFLLVWDMLRTLSLPWSSPSTVRARIESFSLPIIGLASISLFALWHIVTGQGYRLMLRVSERVIDTGIDFVSGLLDTGTGAGDGAPETPTETSPATPTETSPATPTETSSSAEGQPRQPSVRPVDQSLFTLFRRFFADWIFQFVLAVPILGAIVRNWRESDIWVKHSFVFGFLIAAGGVTAWQTGVMSYFRILTYFVVGSGPIAGYLLFKNHSIRSKAALSAVTIFIILMVLMIPAHAVADVQPNYEQGEHSERFDNVDYAASDFVGAYAADQTIIGDGDSISIISINSGISRVTRTDPVRTGKVPSDSIFVLKGPRNNMIFFGTGEEGSLALYTPGLSSRLSVGNSEIYTSGQISLYTQINNSR